MSSAPAQITVVSFDPLGELLVAGLIDGQCVFYNAKTMNYVTSVKVKNRYSGLNARPPRVTGCQFDKSGKRLLVTTNDSNIRLVSMTDFTITMKFKGTVNKDSGTIRAFFSGEDEQHIICGSQGHNVYVWRTNQNAFNIINGTRAASKNRKHHRETHGDADQAISLKKLKQDRKLSERALRLHKFVIYGN